MRIKYNKINWEQVQFDYNCGMTQQELCQKYNFGKSVLANAIKYGLFIKDPARRAGHKHTEQTKKKLSDQRKAYLKENPDKHPWKNHSKFKSEPCEKMKQLLREKNIIFHEEFSDFPQHNYTIDIAFPDDKIGIEINGNQHYNKNGKLTEYYQKREDYLRSLGWKIYQIHYSLIYNKNIIENILNNISNCNYSQYVYIFLKKYCSICGKQLKRNCSILQCAGCLKKEKDIQKIEARKQIILSSTIDFSKFGWVEKLSKEIQLVPQHISHWMKKYMPEFYQEKCFKKMYKVVYFYVNYVILLI